MTDNFFAIAQVAHTVTLWLLILLSVLSLAFILERFFTLSKVKKDSKRISERLRDIMQSNHLSELEEIGKEKNTLEGRALSYGLRHMHERGVNGLEEIFSSYALNERPNLEKYLGFLATVGSNAPFIGLLGTVFGIMDAFRAMAQQQGGSEPTAVMAGISTALTATAIGLMVAIPAVISYNFFQKQVKGVMQNLESAKELCLAYAKTGAKKG